jgi:hypothetical protein
VACWRCFTAVKSNGRRVANIVFSPLLHVEFQYTPGRAS